MANIVLDKEAFFRRVKRLYADWKVCVASCSVCRHIVAETASECSNLSWVSIFVADNFIIDIRF